MTPRPRAALRALTPAVHGAVTAGELAQHGLALDAVLDFSVSTNPCGPSPAALVALRAVDPGRYPDPEARELRSALAARCGVPVERVAVGNGSAELIWAVAAAYVAPGDRALVVGPTFGEYAAAVRAVDAALVEWRARAADGFAVDVAALGAVCAREQPRLVFLCDPNNPTGVLLGAGAVAALLDAAPEALLVVDESYRPFVDAPPDLAPLLARDNLLLLRSLTKDQALAGLRLGYALGTPEAIAALRLVRPAWSVSAAAQAAGLAALDDEPHWRRSLATVREARAYLLERLTAFGLRVYPPAANFLLVEVGDGAAVRAALLRHGCVVRDCASFGLPSCIRIGVRTPPECARLVEAIRAVLVEDVRVSPVADGSGGLGTGPVAGSGRGGCA